MTLLRQRKVTRNVKGVLNAGILMALPLTDDRWELEVAGKESGSDVLRI